MSEPADRHAEALKTAQARLMEGRLDEAAAMIEAVLAEAPDQVDALYAGAVCARYRKRFDEADALLGRLKAAQPEFGRAHQEEGYLRRESGQGDRALAAFQRACRYNPSLTGAWRAQAELLQAAGRTGEAASVLAQAERLEALPRPVLAVSNLLHEGKLLKAEQLCRAFLQKNPRHVEAMRLLAEIGVRFGVLDDAELLLEKAVEFEPENVQLRLDFIQVLRKRQKFDAALEQSRRLHERKPDDPVFQSHYAIENMQTGDYERALSLFDAVLKTLPDDPATLTSRAHALKTMGRQDEAVEGYRAAAARKPDHGDAWYGLANLKTYRFTDDEIVQMRTREAGGELSHADRIHLCFALGKALEDREDWGGAFGYYERGNALKQAQTRYTSEQMEEEFAAQKAFCTAELFERQGGKGCPVPDPIFILGLPRAGSTLIEQILASHSRVDGTLELPNILSMAHQLRGRDKLSDRTRYPRVLGEMDAEALRALGEEYIETTRTHRAGAPFFTDKMPNNFRHIGLIRLILPNAKIIDARRDAMDCCWSGFKQLFAEGQEFTYGLEEIGRYYRGYVDLMAHWDAVLPGQILRVSHEALIEDLEGQVRCLLDFCGLDFEPACLDFHRTDRAVRTASSEQVRQPINRSGMARWRPFEPWLGPLKDALGSDLAPREEDAV